MYYTGDPVVRRFELADEVARLRAVRADNLLPDDVESSVENYAVYFRRKKKKAKTKITTRMKL